MGLDMYLEARKYVVRNDYSDGESREREQFTTIINAVEAKELIDVDGFAGMTVSIPVGYWRKDNWIHNWFVCNVQKNNDDCKQYYVSHEKLEELRTTCLMVLNNPDIEKEGKRLLPPVQGFFFGADQDEIFSSPQGIEYYKGSLIYTIDVINKVLNEPNSSELDVYYHSSW